MFQKLEDVEKKYEDLTQKISDPEIINRQSEWKMMMKEHAELEPIVEKYREYKKTEKNRTIRINKELTEYHKEVIDNLESIHGALLRMNRSIQSEGTFGVMKYDRWYKRTVRKGQLSVDLEIYLVSIGHNLYKYHNKINRVIQ